MGAYSDILAGMLGSVVRQILNKLGADTQLSYRSVSAYAEIENEINYWTTGTIVFARAEGRYYAYDGATWNAVSSTPLVDNVQFNTLATVPSYQEGLIYYDNTEHALSIYGDQIGVSLQVGQEFWVRIVNKTGSTLLNGQVVFISGAQGNRPTASLAIASSVTSDAVIGVVTEDIVDNGTGYVTTMGTVHDYDTSGFTEGDTLYVSETVAGALQNIEPISPNHAVRVGVALNSTLSGSIFVDINTGQDLGLLHDIALSSEQCGDVLTYTAVDELWKNRQPHPISTKTADYTATRMDDGNGTILVDTTTADITITLPLLSDPMNPNMRLTVKKIDTAGHVVIIAGNGYPIDGQSSKQLSSQHESITIHADSSAWWIV